MSFARYPGGRLDLLIFMVFFFLGRRLAQELPDFGLHSANAGKGGPGAGKVAVRPDGEVMDADDRAKLGAGAPADRELIALAHAGADILRAEHHPVYRV